MDNERYHVETDASGNRYLVTERARSAWDKGTERAGAWAGILSGLFILGLCGRFALFAPDDALPDTRTVVILTFLFALPGIAILVFSLRGLRRPVEAMERERLLVDDDLIDVAENHKPELLPLLLGGGDARRTPDG